MSLRGLYIALTDEEKARLLAGSDDDTRLEIVQDIEDLWDKSRIQETDKAWYPIHMALTGRRPVHDPDRLPESYPLDHVVMGGTKLYDGEDYIIRLIEPSAVRDIAAGLASLDTASLRQGYDKAASLDPDEVNNGDEDFQYAMEWFEHVKSFFARESQTGRTIVFSSDW